jgi:hypothetical protein
MKLLCSKRERHKAFIATQLCFPGMRRISGKQPNRRVLHTWNASHSLNAHIWVVAAYPKRAAFQHLQGYITTKLERFSGCDKVLFPRHSNENIIILASSLDHHYQAVLVRKACFADGLASFSPSAVRSWKSLSSQELGQKWTSPSLVLDREEKVIICTERRYALKPSDVVSKHLREKHGINAKEGHGLNDFRLRGFHRSAM